jgi:hypothetical protein
LYVIVDDDDPEFNDKIGGNIIQMKLKSILDKDLDDPK